MGMVRFFCALRFYQGNVYKNEEYRNLSKNR